MQEKNPSGFVKIPLKIFNLGLDSYEIAAFAALASHGGENAQGIFPSLLRLVEMTGMSRRKLWDALDGLARRNVIQWDRGKKGKANTYYILGEGAWSRRVDKSAVPCGTTHQGSAPHALPVVHQAHQGSAPHALPVVHQAHPNQIQLNQSQLTRGGASQNDGTEEGARTEVTPDEAKRRIREMLAGVGRPFTSPAAP